LTLTTRQSNTLLQSDHEVSITDPLSTIPSCLSTLSVADNMNDHGRTQVISSFLSAEHNPHPVSPPHPAATFETSSRLAAECCVHHRQIGENTGTERSSGFGSIRSAVSAFPSKMHAQYLFLSASGKKIRYHFRRFVISAVANVAYDSRVF